MTTKVPIPSPIRRWLPAGLMVALVAAIYHGWFTAGISSWGDWGYYTLARMRDFWPLPPLWNASGSTGGMDLLSGPMYPQLVLHGLLAHFGISFAWSERLIWFFPAVFVGCIGAYIFSHSLFKSRLAAALTGVFMVANSYILLIDAGGQLTVGMAYACIPLILWSFRAALLSGTEFHYVLTALFIATQVMYDLRLTYITIWMLLLYAPFLLAGSNIWRLLGRLCRLAGICFVMGLLIHLPWLLPSVLVKAPSLPHGYTGAAAILDTVSPQNAMTLLHPFWMSYAHESDVPIDPAFVATSLLVFAPLLRSRLRADVQYLYAIGLIAIFLVKSISPPGGNIYQWLFLHLPGFSFFREPSKFYQPVMVAAAVLLGYAALWGLRVLNSWCRSSVLYLFAVPWVGLCLLAAVYPATPALFGTLKQNLDPHPLSPAYARLNAMIDGQGAYFRTLWYPVHVRYGAYSELHPALETGYVGAQYFGSRLPDSGDGNSWLRLPGAVNAVPALSVKYVIVPSDPDEEIYRTKAGGVNLGYVEKDMVAQARRFFKGYHESVIGDIHVFTNPHFLPLFYVPTRVVSQVGPTSVPVVTTIPLITGSARQGHTVAAATIQSDTAANARHFRYAVPSRLLPQIHERSTGVGMYDVQVRGAQRPFPLLFLDTYDPHWQAYILPSGASPSWWTLLHAHAISPQDHLHGNGYANAWWINATGSFTVVVAYTPQILALLGSIVSWLTILCSVAFLIWSGSRRRKGASPVHHPMTLHQESMAAVANSA